METFWVIISVVIMLEQLICQYIWLAKQFKKKEILIKNLDLYMNDFETIINNLILKRPLAFSRWGDG